MVLHFNSDPLALGCFIYVLWGLTCTTSTPHQLAQSGTIIVLASLAVCCFSLFQLILDMINHFIQWYVDWVIIESWGLSRVESNMSRVKTDMLRVESNLSRVIIHWFYGFFVLVQERSHWSLNQNNGWIHLIEFFNNQSFAWLHVCGFLCFCFCFFFAEWTVLETR